MGHNVSLIINDSEITAGKRGASLGPDAIIAAARCQGSHFFDREITRIPSWNHLLDKKVEFENAKRLGGLIQVFNAIGTTVKNTLASGQFPFIIAADHGSAGGTMAGIKAAHPDKKLGVVWIDAHGDLHTPYTTPSGNMHGMPLATALGVDNEECARNSISNDVLDGWEQLKNAQIPGPKLSADHLVFVALRDTEPEENHLLKQLSIRNHTVEDLRTNGVQSIAESIRVQLSDCDMIYVSFDVDSMDPELTSYGTGTPVQGGLTPEEAKELLVALSGWEKLVALEVVEVNPCLDEKKNKMAEVTFGLIEAMFQQLEG